MRRSTDCSRASSVPQMWMRGSAPAGRVHRRRRPSARRGRPGSRPARASSVAASRRRSAGEERRQRLAARPCQSSASLPVSSVAGGDQRVATGASASGGGRDRRRSPKRGLRADRGTSAMLSTSRRGERPSRRRQGGGARPGDARVAGRRPRPAPRRAPAPSAAMPPVTRRPRKSASSSARAAWRQAARSMPKAAKGCLRSASSCHRIGVAERPPRRGAGRRRRAASRSSGAPAESSTARPQRPSSAATRRASVAVGRDQRRGRRPASRPPRGRRARSRAPPPARSARR